MSDKTPPKVASGLGSHQKKPAPPFSPARPFSLNFRLRDSSRGMNKTKTQPTLSLPVVISPSKQAAQLYPSFPGRRPRLITSNPVHRSPTTKVPAVVEASFDPTGRAQAEWFAKGTEVETPVEFDDDVENSSFGSRAEAKLRLISMVSTTGTTTLFGENTEKRSRHIPWEQRKKGFGIIIFVVIAVLATSALMAFVVGRESLPNEQESTNGVDGSEFSPTFSPTVNPTMNPTVSPTIAPTLILIPEPSSLK